MTLLKITRDAVQKNFNVEVVKQKRTYRRKKKKLRKKMLIIENYVLHD